MKYSIPIDIIVEAENKEHALQVAQEEMDYLCGLDNPMCAVLYPRVKDIIKEEP